MPTARRDPPARRLLEIRGPDWRRFLQGLLTQSVDAPCPDEARYGAFLTPQGRVIDDVFLYEREAGDGALLDLDARSADETLERLRRHRLRAKVELTATPGAVDLAPPGPRPGPDWRRDPRRPELGWRRPSAREAHGDGADRGDAPTFDLEAERVRLAVADPAEDSRGGDYALDLNLDLVGAVDFRKGCYVGQETTSRMHRRSGARQRLLPLDLGGAVAPYGAEVLCGDLRAGEARASAGGLVLALLRLDRIGGALTVEGAPAALRIPDWMRPHLPSLGREGP